MQHKAQVFAGMLLAGCTVGAPPGFSGGDHWTFPLVGPLEDGVLLTPVSVHGHGPYLFAIDPDANVTAIDKQVVEEAGLRMGTGPHRIDETDTGQIRFYAELFDLKVAGLTVDRRDVMVFPVGLYDIEGRHVRGVLGRDVLADSLVFGFDRDQGIATLSTVKAWRPPPGAITIKYEVVSSKEVTGPAPTTERQYDPDPKRLPREASLPIADTGVVTPIPRRVAAAQIGPARFGVHLDLGAVESQLPEANWSKAGLVPVDVRVHLVDEAASGREVTTAGVATEVMLGAARTQHVPFVPFIDKRFGSTSVDGALGLGFFRPYAVYANWDASTFYLKPRGDAAAMVTARLGRWGADVPACPHPGCVSAELTASQPGVKLQVTRDARAAHVGLEVLLGATPAAGVSAAPLVVELPPTADTLTADLPAEYAGATLAVLDVSPFPRTCPGDGGCVQPLGAPRAFGAEPASPAHPAPRTVAIEKLHRLAGEAAIPPSDDARRAAAGKPMAAAIVKVCLSPDGKVDTTKLVKSSGVPAYDAELERTIRTTWTFEPAETEGKNEGKTAPVCTQATFLPR